VVEEGALAPVSKPYVFFARSWAFSTTGSLRISSLTLSAGPASFSIASTTAAWLVASRSKLGDRVAAELHHAVERLADEAHRLLL
jgi:hypothetical protein